MTKKHQALQNAQQQDLQGTNVTATLFNYQKALAAAERQAGVLYKDCLLYTSCIVAKRSIIAPRFFVFDPLFFASVFPDWHTFF